MTATTSSPSAPVTHRRVLAIALPIALSNAAVPLLGAVDTAVVGRLGTVEVGAVGLGSIILAFILGIFGFLRMSTTGLVAQAAGAGDADEAGAHLVRALALGMGFAVAITILQGLVFYAGFRLAPASPEVEAAARLYLRIRIWVLPAAIGLIVINGWLIGVERTRAVLVLSLAINVVNAGLNILFALGFGWGVAGVAWASLIAELMGFGFGLWLAREALLRVWTAGGRIAIFARDRVVRLVRVNGDILIRSLLLQTSFTSFLFLSAAEGDMALAANQVLVQLIGITTFALDGFAFAAEALVGRAVGLRRPEEVRRSAMLSAFWGGMGAVAMTLLFVFGGGMLIDTLTTLPDLREASRVYLPWVALYPIISIASWMLDGVFVGATLTSEMRRAMLLAAVFYVVSVVIMLPIWGNHGLWLSLLAMNAVRAVTMLRWYPRAEAAAGTHG